MRSLLLLLATAFLLNGCAYMKSTEKDTGSKTSHGGLLVPFGLVGFGYVIKKPE